MVRRFIRLSFRSGFSTISPPLDDIGVFIEEHGLALAYPLMDLGGGNFVGEVDDPDGNPIRLWMHKK